MNEIDVIKCKYKFQDEEKFEGKSYCYLQNELCEDISFACDTNCQVYEDYKQLHRYKQAIKEIEEIAEKSCCLQPTSTCEEYENCKECNRISDDETVTQILQKINECEVENAR